MITQYRPSYYQSPRASSFAGCSVDDKPLDVENGSIFKEIDTGRVFRYDKENNIWIEWKNTKRSFRFTVFQDGQMHSGLLGTEAEK